MPDLTGKKGDAWLKRRQKEQRANKTFLAFLIAWGFMLLALFGALTI